MKEINEINDKSLGSSDADKGISCSADTLLQSNTFFLDREQLTEHLESIGTGCVKYRTLPDRDLR